ncbi:uncharacterized protein KD926_008782 [Aspergillus affinis]|uniref:uncharacterized protein n=1 Tax=Aspergillus affinis TaxID=1070780 RepID=UPI0022FEF224|nr:uncharacterized protein KD926_008782 [Aspergillus affinis]KAI9045356.1 hypothetical protein KD926_008782 [Aspergillus affinis]
MRIFSALSGLLLAGAAFAQNSSSSCSPKSGDVQVVQFGWALQYLAERYYSAQPLNQTFLNSVTNSSRANYYNNFQGIQRQNRLGVRAVQQLGSQVSGFSAPRCNYTFPSASDGETWVKNALKLEQSITGALIGLSGYTQSPEVSFLLARLSAEHNGHAYYIASQQQGTVFPTNSSSLVPAYTPDWVLQNGTQPGKLGTYLKNCVSPPSSPCGEKLKIGPLIGTFGSNSTNSTSNSSASASPSAGLFAKMF